MEIDGKPYRTIWTLEDERTVRIIDQTRLPHEFTTVDLENLNDAATAIQDMLVRGAPLIGATGAYGMALAMRSDSSEQMIETAYEKLLSTRPTASNLYWALADLRQRLQSVDSKDREQVAYDRAAEICDQDVEICRSIGKHGVKIIETLWESKGRPEQINILTHCNAGWLATVDWGTALAPIYLAHEQNIPVHVWVDETRPRNQGASLTAWELMKHGVSHTVITDNAGGHLMQKGLIDLCIVGTDRTAASGDVCNKVGTYLKALAAQDNEVPFYVALPHTTIDWAIYDGLSEIPIETRSPEEVTHISGKTESGRVETVQLTPDGVEALNIAFDVTPACYVTGLITERGVCPASREGLLTLYPERAE